MARRHASQQDFELVGMDSDPTPGDPDLIQGVITRYRNIGDAAQTALDVLKKDGSMAQGKGSAMDALRKKVGDDLPSKLNKTQQSYHDAAQAYTDYIPKLQEAQDTFDRAVDQAQTAAPKANQTVPTLADDATDQQKADARKAQDDANAGQDELNAAKSLAQQAKSMRQSAQKACSDVLDKAASEAIPERNIFQKIADFFKDFPFVQILLAALVAIVSVFFPVAGAILGGTLFALTQVSAIANGDFSLGEFATGLLGLIPGAGVIAKGAGAIGKGAAAVGKVAPAGGKVAQGGLKGIGSSIANSKTIGPLVNSNGGKIAGSIAKGFGEGAGEEAASQAIDGKGFDAGAILGAGAFGVAGAGAAKGLKNIPKKGTGNPAGTTTRGVSGNEKSSFADNEKAALFDPNSRFPQSVTAFPARSDTRSAPGGPAPVATASPGPSAPSAAPKPDDTAKPDAAAKPDDTGKPDGTPVHGDAAKPVESTAEGAGAAAAVGAGAAVAKKKTKKKATAGSSAPKPPPTFRPAAAPAAFDQNKTIPLEQRKKIQKIPLNRNQTGLDLSFQEKKPNTHGISRHSNKTPDELFDRLKRDKIPVSSSFTDQATAEKANLDSFNANQDKIAHFVHSTPAPKTGVKGERLELRHPLSPDSGIVVKDNGKGGFSTEKPDQVTTIIEREQEQADKNKSPGFKIVTTFPSQSRGR